MIQNIFLSLFLLYFTACSIKTPPNQWQYKSATAFNSYTKNFLRGNDALAKNDLKRAINHAKTSADFTQLAKIHLGVCALNISVGEVSSCKKYKELSVHLQNKSLDAYYHLLIASLTNEDIKNLPQQYQEFSTYLHNKEIQKAIQSVKQINKSTSKLLSYALIKKHLTEAMKEKIIQEASFYGYKKISLFWLEEILKNTQEKEKKKKLQKQISIMRGD